MVVLRAARRTAFGLACLVLPGLGCGWAYNTSAVLVLTEVDVPENGGSAEVMFQGLPNQQVLISLAGRLTTMQPYGNLIGPEGSQSTTPPTNGASNGFNSAQVTLPVAGTYRLQVLDGSKKGGPVTVRVEVVSTGG